MKIKTFLLLIVIGFFNCTQTPIKTQNALKGNWKTKDFRNKHAYIFTFQDSLCSYLYPWGEYSKYWVNDDILNIKKEKVTYKFLIDSISSKKLTLIPITNKTKKLINYSEDNILDKIELTKIKNEFDWKIERIAFYSTVCYGTCPSMYLEIDSIGNLYFNGKNYTEQKGFYFGKLSKKDFETIILNINSINIGSLEEKYDAHWTDDQTCGIFIKTTDTTYKSSAYGFDREPIELRIHFHKLTEVYKNVTLKKDSTIDSKWKFEKFQYELYPPPPPPIKIEENK